MRRSVTRPQLPENYTDLCTLCRCGKLFAVQDWFRIHKYKEPERYDSRHWPIGIAIESRFHSLVEVLLKNGVPADERALWCAARFRNEEIVELIFQSGATVDMVNFQQIVSLGDPKIIRMFMERGADLITGYPIAKGLIRSTHPFLGIYKAYIERHPELQFQADLALRHFCEEGNLRGVSLLMWLGANPRANVPREYDESEEFWSCAMDAAANNGQLDIIKRLKPDYSKDDINALLRKGLWRRKMDLVKYWVSLGADINHIESSGHTAHSHVIWGLSGALNPRRYWQSQVDLTEAKRFALEWFSSEVKWSPVADDVGIIRKVISRLSYMEAYALIKLFIRNQVIAADVFGGILDTPKLRAHLKERRAAIVALLPTLQKWVKSARTQTRS